ncbi:MAG: hypothetical protein QOD90_549 [Mycobacterium sp.]|nr:hypothetical protein [Mycobacterium sp.]
MLGLEFGKGTAQRVRLVGTDAFDEVDQCRFAATRVRYLVKRVDHQSCDQFVAAVSGCVPVRAIVSVLHHEVLLR